QAAEVDGHQERGHLVLRNVVAGVAEDELADLVGRELAAVALALDQLGWADHGSHTKTATWRLASSGPVSGGSRAARWPPGRCAASQSGNVTFPRPSRRSTIVNWRSRAPSALSTVNPPAGAPRSPTSSQSSPRLRSPLVAATSRPSGRSTRRSSRRARLTSPA